MRRRAFLLALRISNSVSSASRAEPIAIVTRFSRYWRTSTAGSDSSAIAGKDLMDRPVVTFDGFSERSIKAG